MADLSRRGLVTAVVCSEPFVQLGRVQARVLGVPELPLLVIPHPLGGQPLDQVQARAALAVAAFVQLLQPGTR